MANIKKVATGGLKAVKSATDKGLDRIDVDAIKDKASDIKDMAVGVRDDIEDKLTELDRMLEQSITDYNDAFTIMNDNGFKLYLERTRSEDILLFIEGLINSIANHPKEFDSEFEEINANRKAFDDACAFAEKELSNARAAASGAGAGIVAGASVAFMAPTAAMWVATTFGTASTGTAISTLSGAAATNAALAWLGGGAAATGGGGIAAGNALLALAGPVGWTIAGATLLSSILLFTKKRMKINKEKNAEITAVKSNISAVEKMNAEITNLLSKTQTLRENINLSYLASLRLNGCNFSTLSKEEQHQLAALVNNAKALSALLGNNINSALVEE